VQKQFSRHIIAIIAFKILMLGVMGYLFYGFIGRPHVTGETIAANFFTARAQTQ
jgi:hypothetical protein